METPIEKQKISTQANPEKWQEIKRIAQEEGRNTDAIVDEAFTFYLEKRKEMAPRKFVMDAYNSSHKRYAELYRMLAK